MRTSENGISLIELLIVISIVAILAKISTASYSQYRLRAERANGENCLTDLARKQEGYFARSNTYATDLTALGYGAASAASCVNTTKYLLTAAVVDTTTCPLSRCYRLTAAPQNTQAQDGNLYFTYDSSQADPTLRVKKERGTLGSGTPWNN